MASTSTLDRPAGGNCGLPAERMIEISFDDRALLEIAHDRRFVFGLLGFVVGALLLFPLFLPVPRRIAWIVFGGLMAAVLVIGVCCGGRIWRYVNSVERLKRVDELCRLIESMGVGPTAKAAIWAGSGAMPQVAELLIRAIHSAGMGPHALRMCRSRHAGSIAPLRSEFEPLALDEAEQVFRDLEKTGVGADEAERGEALQTEGARLRRKTYRRMRRNVLLAGGVGIVATSLTQIAIGVLQSISWWTWDWRVALGRFALPALLLAVVLALPRGSLMHWRRQWFVVPGGVIVRRSGWLDRAWRVHCFRRDTAVLFVHESARGEWRAQVGDRERVELEYMTRREAALLLRAWLSPLEPPEADRLGDLK